MYIEGVAAGYYDISLRDGKPEKEIKCVMAKITPEFALPILAPVYATEFTDDELRQAISFFQTKVGKDFVRSQRKVIELRGASDQTEPNWSAAEWKEMDAFAATHFGAQIMNQQTAIAAASREKLRPHLYSVFDQCQNAK
jgi:hypothetical protein